MGRVRSWACRARWSVGWLLVETQTHFLLPSRTVEASAVLLQKDALPLAEVQMRAVP